MGGKTKVERNKMYFIGVTTTQSIINKIFPSWMKILNSKMELECVDVPMNAEASIYRELVNKIKNSKSTLGALVTTHKIPLYAYASDLFDALDNSSQQFKEIGCIYKKHNRLIGEATDILTVKKAFKNIWTKERYSDISRVHICILGCGGAGVALAYELLSSEYDNISQIIMVDVIKERINNAQKILGTYDKKSKMHFCLSDGVKSNDQIVNSLPDNAFVVNASGVGKDIIGSPVSWEVELPNGGCLWEYNYRGHKGKELEILKIAYQQSKHKHLSIYDGFNYFLYGWTTVISRILNMDINDQLFDILANDALNVCGKTDLI